MQVEKKCNKNEKIKWLILKFYNVHLLGTFIEKNKQITAWEHFIDVEKVFFFNLVTLETIEYYVKVP